MRKALLLTVGLVLAATSAWGQSTSRDRNEDSRGEWRESYGRWDRDRDDRRGRFMRDDDDGRSGGGSRFYLRSGDTQLRVVCGDREPTRTCVDAALMMFERVQSQQGAAARAPDPSPSAPTPPGSPPYQ